MYHWLNKRKIQFLLRTGNPQVGVFPLLFRLVGELGTSRRLARSGLQPIDIIQVEVEQLLIQRAVRCEVIPVKEASLLSFLDVWFTGRDGMTNRCITSSPQYRFAQADMNDDLPADLQETDYWQWHVSLRQAGINEDKRSDEWIASKIEKLRHVFGSIRDRGYDYSRLANYVWVLEKPLCHTRYGYDYSPDGYEIYDGHHRAASIASLGYHTVHVLLLRDVGMCTSFGVPLDEVVVPKDSSGALGHDL